MGRSKWRAKQGAWDTSGVTAYQLAERGISDVGEWEQALRDRQDAGKALQALVAQPGLSGQEKQWARCAYVVQHSRLPFQCRGCWLLPGNCVCARLWRCSSVQTKLVIHFHPDEWWRGSNTGCLCAALAGCELLMRGHRPHDEALQALLENPSFTTALLWPGEGALSVHELRQLAEQRSGGRIALIAIDGTWDGALRMRRRYPPGVLTLKLPPEMALPRLAPAAAAEPSQQPQPQPPQPQQPQPQPPQPQQPPPQPRACVPRSRAAPAPDEPVSLFRPLRKYRGSAADNGRVCTLEAVAGALLALEGDAEVYEGLLANLRLKVDAMRWQKHMPLVHSDAGHSPAWARRPAAPTAGGEVATAVERAPHEAAAAPPPATRGV